MALKIVFGAIEFIALLAAAYFGYHWYVEPSGNNEPPFAIAAFALAIIIELIRRYAPSRGIDPEKIANFIREGQALRARLNEDPLPIQEHNDWVERMISYFKHHKGCAYEVRLSDFSGMTFVGSGCERSKMSNAIEGRIRRLHEFISELDPK